MFTKSKPLVKRQTFFLLCLVFFAVSCEEKNNVPFDKLKWKQADRRERGKMIPDLYNSKILLHKTNQEIVDLLGTPLDSGEYFLAYDFDNGKKYLGSTWVYYMQLHIDSTSKTCESISWDD
jgi:hypothetical protein